VAPDASFLAGPAPPEATFLTRTWTSDASRGGHLALGVDGHYYARPHIFQMTGNDGRRANVQWASDYPKGDP
jgi:hypothetical protein